MSDLGDAPVSKERFLEELICLENRIESKISEIRTLHKDLTVKQRNLEEQVMAHVIEEENSHVDEDVEKIKERVYDPEKGVIVMQQSICAALEKLHEELATSDKILNDKLTKQSNEFKKFKKKMNEKMSNLQRTIWIVGASAVGIYIVDNPAKIFEYLQKALASAATSIF